MIQMIDLAARHRSVAQHVEDLVLGVLRSGRYIGGPLVAQVEAEVARLWGRAQGVGVNSGTDALVLALQALGVGPGHEVIIPAVSFFATAGAVIRVGARPVVVDVLDTQPVMDPDAARRARSPHTRAVIPVHLFGISAPHPDIGVPVVDDVAQAAGGDPPRGQGVLAALSFYPTKVLGGAGDGGMVLTDDPSLTQKLRQLGNHGAIGPHQHAAIAGHAGTNSRLDALQAAVILGNLTTLEQRYQRRQAIASRYRQALDPALWVPHDAGSPISIFCLRHPHRDHLAQALRTQGIQSAVYYPRPLSDQACMAEADVPNATRFCQEALAIPCHAHLSDQDVDRIIQAIQAAA